MVQLSKKQNNYFHPASANNVCESLFCVSVCISPSPINEVIIFYFAIVTCMWTFLKQWKTQDLNQQI